MKWHLKRQDPELLPALYRLRREASPESRELVDGAILYAEIGRDRNTLTFAYLDKCRAMCDENDEWLRKMRDAFPRPR